MNERIQELAVRAREQTEEFNSVRNKLTAEEWTEIYDEKFAELIVKECMTVARGADGLDATHEAWYLIKQHFGVGE